MEKFLLLANWKANKTVSEGDNWVSELVGFLKKLGNLDRIKVVVAPPYPLFASVKQKIAENDYPISLASQDISAFDVGSYTGEVPARILASLSVDYCLIGHSERRKYLHETLLSVEAKIKQALENKITPIVCARTLEEIPANLRNYPSDKFIVMYEPFSAISTDGQYHPESPEKVVAVLSEWKSRFGQDCRFLYGGSVSPNDVQGYLEPRVQNPVSGFVVGHASLAAETFFAIINKCLQSLSLV